MIYEHLEDVPGIEKIIPERYVWHLSSPENRASILKFGLTLEFGDHKCIFANNQSFNVIFMYPFCLEEENGRYRPDNLLKYDFWRIDTARFKADWYIDPNMKDGPIEYMGDEKYFVATETPIPCEAIELFEVGQEFIYKRMYVILSGKNKASGWSENIALRGKKNLDIKKEVSEYRKTHEAIKTKAMRSLDVKDHLFPLVMHNYHLKEVSGIKRIVPERYVWHVSKPKNRKAILEFGLKPDASKHKSICANNQSFNVIFMYPFCLEAEKGRYRPNNLLKYDFWRIDTHSFQADWYIDSNMKNSPKKYECNEKDFVATETPIPCKAIELFKVGQEFIDIKKNVYITSIEKSTGLEGITIINCIDDNYIKNYMKEIKSEIRKTDKIINSKTSRFSYVKDVAFPLVKVA
jgi:hypothetical protein